MLKSKPLRTSVQVIDRGFAPFYSQTPSLFNITGEEVLLDEAGK